LAILPTIKTGNDLVSDIGSAGRGNVEVPREAGIISHDVMKILCLLKRSNNRGAGALNNLDDPSLLPAVTTGTSMVSRLLDEPSHDAVAIERSTEIVRGNEEILSSLVLCEDMAGSPGMKLKLSGEKVRRLGKNIMIATNADNPATSFQPSQNLIESTERTFFQMKSLRYGGNRHCISAEHFQNTVHHGGSGGMSLVAEPPVVFQS
jgi:hypothetical protein